MGALIILGGGTAGTMAANQLRPELGSEWTITVVDQDRDHHYQPGYVFVPFGKVPPERLVRDRAGYLHDGVDFVEGTVAGVAARERRVHLADGRTLTYDWLVIASGTAPRPDQVPGMADGPLWRTAVHEFYTLPGAIALRDAVEKFTGGRLLVHVCEMPIKCPVAPLEVAFLLEDHFRKKGIRHKVDITYVTPLDGAFTKPVAAEALGGLLDDRSIRLATDFTVERIDNDARTLVAYDGRALPFDLLVTVPPNMGQQFVTDSGLGNDAGFVPVDKHTLRAHADDRIFVVGDASDIPTSKAGSVAHFSIETVVANVVAATRGEVLPKAFDGHANCFVETGRGEALLLDFNYETEPLPGTYPAPLLGPMRLLRRSRLNHLGKLAFEHLYWRRLLPGKALPVPTAMSMTGKHPPGQSLRTSITAWKKVAD